MKKRPKQIYMRYSDPCCIRVNKFLYPVYPWKFLKKLTSNLSSRPCRRLYQKKLVARALTRMTPQVVPRPDLRAPKNVPRLRALGRQAMAAVLLLGFEEVACASSSSSSSSSMREQTWRKSWGLSVMTPSMRTDEEEDWRASLSEREDVDDEEDDDDKGGGDDDDEEEEELGMFLRMHHSIHLGWLTVQAKTGRPAAFAFLRNQVPRGPTRMSWSMLKARLGMGRKWFE